MALQEIIKIVYQHTIRGPRAWRRRSDISRPRLQAPYLPTFAKGGGFSPFQGQAGQLSMGLQVGRLGTDKASSSG